MKQIAIVLHGLSLGCLTTAAQSYATNDIAICFCDSEDYVDRSHYSLFSEDVCADIIDAIDLVLVDQYCIEQEGILSSKISFYSPILFTCENRELCRGSPI